MPTTKTIAKTPASRAEPVDLTQRGTVVSFSDCKFEVIEVKDQQTQSMVIVRDLERDKTYAIRIDDFRRQMKLVQPGKPMQAAA